MYDTDRLHRPAGRARSRTRETGATPGLLALVVTLLLLSAQSLAGQAACGTSVTVRSGDTLAEIAARCGTTVSALVRANEQIEDPNSIRAGWELTIPTRTEQASPEPEPQPEPDVRREPAAATHTVSPGETLALIAREHGTTIRALLDANPVIEDPALIQVGWELEIPGRGDERRPESPIERPDERETYPDAAVRVASRRAAPGEEVEITVRGFPPNHPVNIGVGPWRSEFTVVDQASTDAGGQLSMTVRMPDWADAGDRFVFVVDAPNSGVRVMTDPIVVRRESVPDGLGPDLEPGQKVRISGTLTDEGVECQALRSRRGDLFTLAGDTRDFEIGDRVQVVGTVPELSVCQQGTTIEVEEMAVVEEDFGLLKPVIRVEGRLSDDGVECQALRSDRGELYTLVGNLEDFGTGDRVYIEGIEVELSTCQQGTTLEIRVIRPAGPPR